MAASRPARVALALLATGVGATAVGSSPAAAAARAAVRGSRTLADYERRGRLVVWEPSAGAAAAGAVGAGWSSAAADGHAVPTAIVLIGTSHIIGSAESAAAVRELVALVQPDAVVVELCRSRRSLMYAPVETSRSAPSPYGVSSSSGDSESALDALRRTVQLGGLASLVLRLVLARTADGTRAEYGDTPYADFVATREAAEAVGATLVLGDRPLEITLERAWLAMTWGQRLTLGRLLLSPRAPSGDAAAGPPPELDEMAALLTAELPGLYEALVAERDIYLSLTCRASRAVSGKRLVVGVVGAGHVAGVARALGEEHAGAFKALTSTPRRTRAKVKVLGLPAPLVDRLLFDSALALALFAASRAVSPSGAGLLDLAGLGLLVTP
jgi:pheromone shutdown protein TraB